MLKKYVIQLLKLCDPITKTRLNWKKYENVSNQSIIIKC